MRAIEQPTFYHRMCSSDFSCRMIVENMIVIGKKIYAAFINHEKGYDCIDWKAIWDVLRICGVGGKSLWGVSMFFTRKQSFA